MQQLILVGAIIALTCVFVDLLVPVYLTHSRTGLLRRVLSHEELYFASEDDQARFLDYYCILCQQAKRRVKVTLAYLYYLEAQGVIR